MIKPKQFADMLQAEKPFRYYVNEFPSGAPDAAAWVRLTGGYPPSDWSPRKKPSMQILVRGPEKKRSELNSMPMNCTNTCINARSFMQAIA
ncbi:hypothetical protein P9222_09105 [Paenibacillus amylolyticus]|nr:hypothetical protein [Paenibacillus amylolyticus]WFR64306.1 hypothetical protein P9222_09105 [Paenibacillus amylolyticus]